MNGVDQIKKFAYIDALRGLAIAGVVIVHTFQYGNIPIPVYLEGIIGNGARGVQLFYVVSAFTLMLSFSQRIGNEHSPVRNFFCRRFFRIAPMYYIGIVYYLWQDGLGPRYWLGDMEQISAFNILSNFTFTHGFNPYWITSVVPGGWSITVEMTFYIMLPFLAKRIKDTNKAFLFFYLAILLHGILKVVLLKFPFIAFERLWKEYLYLYFPSQLPVFALGIMMFYIIREESSANRISGLMLLPLPLLLMIQLALGANIFFPSHVLFGMCFVLLGAALSRYPSVLLVNRVSIYLGKVSYSMYIAHFAILYWLSKTVFFQFFMKFGSAGLIPMILFVFLMVAVVSTITYKAIEVPFQNLGKTLIARLENKSSYVV